MKFVKKNRLKKMNYILGSLFIGKIFKIIIFKSEILSILEQKRDYLRIYVFYSIFYVENIL
jgi:hypothetical protein